MKTSKKRLKNKLDACWRTVGKEDAVCEVCAALPPSERVAYTQLHPHHVVGRINQALRYDLKNRIWLCPSHHALGTKSAHNDPFWFIDWLKEHKPAQYKYIKKHQHDIKQWTIEELEKLGNLSEPMLN